MRLQILGHIGIGPSMATLLLVCRIFLAREGPAVEHFADLAIGRWLTTVETRRNGLGIWCGSPGRGRADTSGALTVT